MCPRRRSIGSLGHKLERLRVVRRPGEEQLQGVQGLLQGVQGPLQGVQEYLREAERLVQEQGVTHGGWLRPLQQVVLQV